MAQPAAGAPAKKASAGKDRTGVWVALLAVLLGAAFVWLADARFNGYRQQLVVLAMSYVIIAVGLTVTSGFTGVFSLGQIGFVAVGAYVSALMSIPPQWKDDIALPGLPPWLATMDLGGLPPWLGLTLVSVAGGLVAAALAVLVGAPLMRLSGHYVAVATMGFLIIVYTVVVNLDHVTSGARGLSPIPTWTTVWSAYVWTVLAIYAAWRIRNSPAGRAMIASRENLLAARGVGVDVLRTRLLAFVFGAFLSGVAGSLLAHQVGTIAPSQFYFKTTFLVVTMIVLGGMGSITGAVVGAVVMTILPEYLRPIDEGFTLGGFASPPLYGLSQILIALGFILVMIFRPQGLFGDREIGLGLLARTKPQQEASGEDIALTPELAPGVDEAPLDPRA